MTKQERIFLVSVVIMIIMLIVYGCYDFINQDQPLPIPHFTAYPNNTTPCSEGSFEDPTGSGVCTPLMLNTGADQSVMQIRSGSTTLSNCTQAALVSALNNFGTVNIPACTIDITAQVNIPSGTIINGSGAGQTIFNCTTGTCFSTKNKKDIIAQDFTIDGSNGPTGDNGINFLIWYANNILLQRVESKENGQGAVVRYSSDVTVRYSDLHDHDLEHGLSSKDCFQITNCQAEFNGSSTGTTNGTLWSTNLAFYSNELYNNANYGLDSHANNVEIAGNKIYGNKRGAKFPDASDLKIWHNEFTASQSDVSCVWFYDSLEGNEPSQVPDNIILFENTFKECQPDSIRFQGDGTNAQLLCNTYTTNDASIAIQDGWQVDGADPSEDLNVPVTGGGSLGLAAPNADLCLEDETATPVTPEMCTECVTPTPIMGMVWNVSKDGSGDFDALDQIDWSVVSNGDVINLNPNDIYITQLTVLVSGVTIEGNGAKIDGGRGSNPLPNCGTLNWADPNPLLQQGIFIARPNTTVNDIEIYGTGRFGIRMVPIADNSTIENSYIHDNGRIDPTDYMGGTESNGAGIWVGGQNVTIRNNVIQDNGEDSIQSIDQAGPLDGLQVADNLLGNTRVDANGAPWNSACTHTDGVHIYNSVHTDIEIQDNLISNVTNGLIFGEGFNGSTVDQVLIQNNEITNCIDNGVLSNNTNNTDWHLYENTINCPNATKEIVQLDGSSNELFDNIFIGNPNITNDFVNSSGALKNGNCQQDISFEIFDPLSDACTGANLGNVGSQVCEVCTVTPVHTPTLTITAVMPGTDTPTPTSTNTETSPSTPTETGENTPTGTNTPTITETITPPILGGTVTPRATWTKHATFTPLPEITPRPTCWYWWLGCK